MASFADRYAASQSPDMQVKAGIAAVLVAVQVMTETAPTVAVDRKRRALALAVLADAQGIAARFALILAAQDMPSTDPDEVIQAKVLELWDAIAGVDRDDLGQR
jgi:hypothetical protein